jgi:hypothetical protein
MSGDNSSNDLFTKTRALKPAGRQGRSGRGGYALLIVLIVILTTTGLAAVHQRHLSAALRIEQARIQSEAHAQGPLRVLAVAIDLLKTGDPPAPVDYSYSHVVGTTTTLFRVRYAVSGAQWTVTAEPDATAGALTPLPASF